MKNKYFNDAIIGNGNATASFSKEGELLRFFYPNPDYRQFIDFFNTGVKINDSHMIYLAEDPNNTYKQYFTEDTNILNTEINNTYFNLKIKQTDFIPIKQNVLIKRYVFKNEGTINLNVDFLVHSKLYTSVNNYISGFCKDNILMQYGHDYSFCIFSKSDISKYQINSTGDNIKTGDIGGKDYVGMSADSSIGYSIGRLKPKEEKVLEIFIYVNENKDVKNIDEIIANVGRVKQINVNREYEKTKKYWNEFVKDHINAVGVDAHIDPAGGCGQPPIQNIYKRSILLFPLLTNAHTGGISAGVEIDESLTECGRYSYCWPRDAIFITKALDLCKMEKETERFYKVFCKQTQLKNGMWEQRYYTDGTYAPAWGYQVDETASIIYGIWEHYASSLNKDKKFLKDNLEMCERAAKFLEDYIENILTEKKQILSYDLWENEEEIHTYSLSAIFGAFNAMLEIYSELKDDFTNNKVKIQNVISKIMNLEKYCIEIKGYILKNLYSNEKKSFVRNTKDNKIDISLLGLVTPFKVFGPDEDKISNLMQSIDLNLRTYTGGYKRFEGDTYAGGNPWPIANLWMAMYYIEQGNREKALECFDYVVESATEHGYLGEQVNNETMQPSWVIRSWLEPCNVCYCCK